MCDWLPPTDVTAVADGYQWYTVATWVPSAGQYIWAGPGQFDQQNGKNSAVKAVYVDCLEIVRADP